MMLDDLQQSAAQMLSEHRLSSKCILHLDDHEIVRYGVSLLLKEHGYTVFETGNTDEALAILKAEGERIDLVIQDVRRPGMEGPEFLRKHLLSDLHRRPCVFLTMQRCDRPEDQWILSTPHVYWVNKDRNPDEILAILRATLSVALDHRSSVLYKAPIITPVQRSDIAVVNEEVVRYLARRREALFDLKPRVFEQLVAWLFRDLGYEVELTPATRDGGRDLRAVRVDEAGPVLYLIECKRYDRHRPVPVGVVRELYGVKQAERANVAIVATTSYFTRDAKAFQRSVGYEMSLRDYQDLQAWLDKYRH